jgi:hypothetical protein
MFPMDITSGRAIFSVGFSSGVAVICLINIALIAVDHHLYEYNWYIFVISLMVLLGYVVLRIHVKSP